MANVLGSLFVNLIANTADFVGGMEKAGYAARRAGKEIEESFSHVGDIASRMLGPLGELGEKLAQTFENVGSVAGKAMASVGSLGAVAVGAGVGVASLGVAMVAAADHAAEVGSQIFEASEKTGLAAENLSGLMAIAKETGSSFEGLTGALAKAEVTLTKVHLAIGHTSPVLLQLMGGAKGVAELGLKPMDDELQIVLKRIFELEDPGQRAVALTALLGKGWKDNVSALKLLAEQGYAPAIDQARKFGIYFNAETAAQARQYKVAVNELTAELTGLGVSLGQWAIPKFKELIAEAQQLPYVLPAAGHAIAGFGLAASGNIMGAIAQWKLMDATVKQGAAAQAGFEKQIADMAKGEEAASKDAGRMLDEASGKVKKHVDLVQQAAEASIAFWEKYHLGLVQITTHFPQVLSYEDAFTKYLQEQDKLIAKRGYDFYNAMRAGNLAAAGLKMPGMVPGSIMSLSEVTARAIDPLPFDIIANRSKKMSDELILHLTNSQKVFKAFFNDLVAQGEDFSTKITSAVAGAVDNMAAQFARLAVTGKASFREIFVSLAQEIIRANIEKAIGDLAGKIKGIIRPSAAGGPAATGTERGSSPTNPLYVFDMAAGPISIGKNPDDGTSGMKAAEAATGVFGAISKLFGGHRAGGGGVSPGRFYIVGERHPEFFVPKQSGQITPGLDFSGQPTVVNFHVHGVSDFDSFRRSSGQVMSMLQNQLASAYARNR